jgi:hypothetical protein
MYMEMMNRTQDMLSPEQLRWLRRLPNHTSWQDCLLGHATPEAPKRWGRIANVNEARKVFSSVRNRISFYGHTHRANVEYTQPWMLNPGAAKDDCCALLEIENGKPHVKMISLGFK